MNHKKNANPIDELITSLTTAFQSVQYDNKVFTSIEVQKIQTIIASGLLGIQGTVTLVENHFLPSVRKEITKTKNNIAKSIYKEFLKDTYHEVEELHYETIRLGYVLAFHKYENFIKDVLRLFNSYEVSSENSSSENLEKFISRKYNFNPTHWHSNPAVHVVSFISNCTKHHNGKCKLKESRYSKPSRYTNLTEEDTIRPSLKDLKHDIKALLESFQILLTIISSCNQVRVLESFSTDFSESVSDEERRLLDAMDNQLKLIIKLYSE